MRETADFLLEIGCEEIPARLLPKAAEELKVILEKYFSSNGLATHARVETFAAPRRLAAISPALLVKQPDSTREILGPPKSVAFDNVGKPTRAAESFAAKQGARVSELIVVSTSRGDYLAARQRIRGRRASEILSEFLPQAILEISWPRSMTWTTLAGPRFIRPIRWLIGLLGGQVIPFHVGDVNSQNASHGHRFLGRARIPLRGSREYSSRLRANFVIVSPQHRQAKIVREIAALEKKTGLRAHPDPSLLEEVVYLNEFPTVTLGEFDPAFLKLPEEILVTVMRDHQKYFAMRRRSGELAPRFLAVMNLDRDRSGEIRRGHERVLRARFADAKFFWDTDQKCRLADFGVRLSHITYESRLGNYAQKVERVRRLSRWLAEQWFNSGLHQADVPAADRAAELAKCDLATEMVREFTELQGIVGGLYARAQGEPEEIALAIYDHYRPVGMDDPIPRNLTGCAVAMADKLDALVGCFAVGLVPSGSSDPFALRRAALGVVKILMERKLPLSLSAAVSAVAKTLAGGSPRISVSEGVERQVFDFLVERARFVFREREGFAYDETSAVLAAGADDLVDAGRRLEALKAIRKTKNFEPLAVAFKRMRKILEKAGPAESWKQSAVRAELFTESAEKELHAAARQIARDVGEQKRGGRYKEALIVISGLRPSVDEFFDRVLVMAEDEATRNNRLTLLAGLVEEFSSIADFSEIVPARNIGVETSS